MAHQPYSDKVNDFCHRLRQRRVEGSLSAAKGTAELLRQLVTSSRLNDPHSLLEEVRSVGIKIQSAKPIELVIGNIVRRVMHIIREEMQEEAEDVFVAGTADSHEHEPIAGGLSRALKPAATSRPWGRTFSLHNLLEQGLGDDVAAAPGLSSGGSGAEGPGAPGAPAHRAQPPGMPGVERRGSKLVVPPWERKQEVIDGVNDLIEELKDIDNAIAAHAPEHIHANEVILTFGYSRTVEQFLQRAREKRDFQAVVAEGAPTLQGHMLARQLAAAGIRTTAIADAAIYAMMARVNKVVISAHALLADGGVMAPVGTALVAAAAKRHSVPFVVLVGIYKLSPHFPHEPGVTFNDFREPSDVLPYADEAMLAAEVAGAAALATMEADLLVVKSGGALPTHACRPVLQVHNPSYDYIPPDLISLLITDHGHGFVPSYVYRQLSEFYHRVDYQLSKELDGGR